MRLKILQHNVHDWTNKRHALYNSYRQIDPDIILLNDTGLPNDEKPKLFGYHTYHINQSNERHSGAAIAIKTSISHSLLNHTFINDIPAIRVSTPEGNLVVATTYLPPRRNTAPITDFIYLSNQHDPTIIMTDDNAKHRTLGSSSQNNAGITFDHLSQHNGLKHIGPDFKTWFGPRLSGTPDHVYTNRNFTYNYWIEPGPLTVSDHIPVVITISTSPIQIPIIPRFSMTKADWTSFKAELDEFEWTDLLHKTKHDIDQELDKVTDRIKTAMTNNIPKISFRVLPAPFPSELQKVLQLEFEGASRLLALGGDPDIARHITTLRNRLKLEQDRIRQEFFADLITKMATLKGKEFWTNYKRLCGSSKQNDTSYITDNDAKLFKPEDKSRAFSRFLETKFTISQEENDGFDNDNELLVDNFLDQNQPRHKPNQVTDGTSPSIQEGFLPCITLEDFNRALKAFKNKAPGESGINKKTLTECPDNIKLALVNIYNASLNLGYFPDLFKGAVVIMIPKTPKAVATSNHRPISLLEIHGKLFERLINDRLSSFLEANNTFKESQHGFRKHRGTDTAITIAHETIAKALQENKLVHVVCRDVKGAFDKVWHNGLKFKLLHRNLPKNIEQTLSNFLDNRTFRVRVDGFTGPTHHILSGVPQGSILSPTLYNLYIHDLPDPLHDCHHIIYADDVTQIITTTWNNKRYLSEQSVREILSVTDFENKWKIQTNPTKFKIISPAQFTHKPPHLTINGQVQDYSQNCRMLGLLLGNAGVCPHIAERVSLANQALGRLRRLQFLTEDQKRTLYTATVRPILEYPPIPLATASKDGILKLQKVQNKGIRFILNHYDWTLFTTMEQLHARAGVPPLNQVLHQRAKNTLSRLAAHNPEIFHNLAEPLQGKEHKWFPRSIHLLTQPSPPPAYLKTNANP